MINCKVLTQLKHKHFVFIVVNIKNNYLHKDALDTYYCIMITVMTSYCY